MKKVFDAVVGLVEEGKWTLEDVEKLAEQLLNFVKQRRQSSETFTYSIEIGPVDPRKGKPYVARLKLSPEGKIEREFFNSSLDYTWGRKAVKLSGTFTAHPGDIIEIRWGGSWKNDYRYWYWVAPDGDLVLVADIKSAEDKDRVKKYLRTGDESVLIMKSVEDRVTKL